MKDDAVPSFRAGQTRQFIKCGLGRQNLTNKSKAKFLFYEW